MSDGNYGEGKGWGPCSVPGSLVWFNAGLYEPFVDEDEDIELIDSICNAILDLRDKYELGNFENRDCADEINAIMLLMHQLLAADDLYACKVSA